ncbi:NAD(P)-dependent oxidoreductase [Nonomuraea candida]|uniref:NAD(P)-dependent oxidoreductase n=1 Tax=Nonomuraea candida TaxID=359159 RepID=UPI0005B7A91D|nr:NAD(P)H-binding protein [Nonomuraea candida]
MGKIVVFGAGGKAGRAAVAEARRRGHQVTAVVRDPAKHGDLAAGEVAVVAGDVTDADSVAAVAAGHDAAISAVYDAQASPGSFYAGAATALLDGLSRAGVGRLLVVGLGTLLETEPGVRLMDTGGFPPEYRPFSDGHAAGLQVLRSTTTGLDWLYASPTGNFDHDGPRAGHYRTGGPAGTGLISYADFAIALLDEIDTPAHHRTHIAFTN